MGATTNPLTEIYIREIRLAEESPSPTFHPLSFTIRNCSKNEYQRHRWSFEASSSTTLSKGIGVKGREKREGWISSHGRGGGATVGQRLKRVKAKLKGGEGVSSSGLSIVVSSYRRSSPSPGPRWFLLFCALTHSHTGRSKEGGRGLCLSSYWSHFLPRYNQSSRTYVARGGGAHTRDRTE